MSATDEAVDQALEGLDEDLNPIEDVEEEIKPEESEESEDESEEDEGYVIDEDEEEEPAEEQKTEVKQPTNLNEEQQFIYDNLPTMSISGKDGKLYNIKVPGELPSDFEFANERDRIDFTAAVTRQEIKAGELQNSYKNQQLQKTSQEFTDRENKAIVDDIAELQKAGEIPKFKLQPTDKDFDSDPAAQLVDEIIDFMNHKNQQYLERSQAGQSYRHIGFEDAYYQYKRENPEKVRSERQREEDSQRLNVGRQIGSRGANSEDTKLNIATSGTTTRDLYAMIDNL